MNFTNSPMKNDERKAPPLPPGSTAQAAERSPCRDCSYWNGSVCVGVCYRDLILPQREGTSGQLGPKSEL